MTLPIGWRPEAQADLLAARDWYEQLRQGLGDKLSVEVERVVERIERMPELYAVEFLDVRAVKLRRFPYVLYYHVLQDRTEVIGVLHGSRDTRFLQDRT